MAKDRKKKEQEKPTYWARIPAQIRYDNELHPGAKILFAEIDCLSRRKGYCWAGNQYFAEKFDISVNTVDRWVKQLVNKDYISRNVNKSKGNLRALSPIPKSTLELMRSSDPIPKNEDSYPHKRGDPIPKNEDSYPHTCGDPIPTDGAPYIRKNLKRELEERENIPLSLPDFLDEKKTKGKIYLSAKMGYPLSSLGFFDWFENEVLKRYPKFTANTLNDTTLRDWDRNVFKKFGKEISTAAVVKLLDQTKGNLPGYSEVVKAAKNIANHIKAEQERKQQLEKKAAAADSAKSVMPDYENMPDADLITAFEAANDFMKSWIRKKRPDVDRIVSAANRTAV